MNDTKMLQAILNRVKEIREDNKNIRADIKNVEEKVDKAINRIDKIGLQMAYLEDDSPTIEDHNKLKRRVRKLELKVDSLSKN